jgi:hypothetical protein
MRELRRRPPPVDEMFQVLTHHFREIHSVSSDAVRIRAMFEQIERIRVRVAMLESHFRAIEQQGITCRFRFALGHRRIDVRAVFQQQLEPRTLILG